MVVVQIKNSFYGNAQKITSESFNSIDSLIDYLLGDWREFICRVTKGNKSYEIYDTSTTKKAYTNNLNTTQQDDFLIDIGTNDHNGVYRKTIQKIDVDGKCILNREFLGNGICKDVVTNACINSLILPLIERFNQKQKVEYAE